MVNDQSSQQPAGFLLRLVAFLVDQTFLGLAEALVIYLLILLLNIDFVNSSDILVNVVMMFVFGTIFLFPIIYYSFLEASKWQTTPGKMIFGFKVIDKHGERIDLIKSTARNILKFIFLFVPPFFLSFLIISFHDEKKGLHDLICQTQVIQRD